MTKDRILDICVKWIRARQALPYIKGYLCDVGCGDRYLLSKYGRGIGFDRPDDLNEGIPFNGQVDTVTMLAVIEHLKPEPILREAYRILKPKGRLIITMPLPHSKWLLDFLAFIRFLNPQQIAEHNYISKSELRRLLTKTGFAVIHSKTFEFGINLLMVAEKL